MSISLSDQSATTDDERRELLRNALVRSGLLDHNAPAPEPYCPPMTGVAGKSSVWLLRLPAGRYLVAKFDTPERACKEWQAILALRRLNTPLAAIMPLESNIQADGVVIYQGVSGLTDSGRVWDFAGLLQRQFFPNPDNCLKALDKVFAALTPFYRGTVKGDTQGEVANWQSHFPKLAPVTLETEIDRLFGPGWRPAFHKRTGLPDPLARLAETLADTPGNVMMSQIHGDLNFSNLLFGLDGRAAPNETFVIDLACWRAEAVTAYDPALMETQFWHSCWLGLCPVRTDPLVVMRKVGQIFNGEPIKVRSPVYSTVYRFVHRLRDHARRILGAGRDDYHLLDYMTALYLHFLRAFHFQTVQRSSVSLRLTYTGACLARQFLDRWETGKAPDFPTGPLVVSSRNAGERSFTGPTNVPPVPVPFVGRKEDLKDLVVSLRAVLENAEPRAIVVHGQAGNGKSTLLARLGMVPAVRRLYPDGVLWTALGQDPRADWRTLVTWCRLCGVEVTGRLARDKAARLSEGLRNKRVLLLIDDVWDTRILGSLLGLSHPSVGIVVSTRLNRIANEVALPPDIRVLHGLSAADAMQLFRVLAPAVARKYPARCETLVEMLAGNPLGLQVAGRLLHRHESYGLGTVEEEFDLLLDGVGFLDEPPPVNVAAFMADQPEDAASSIAALLHRSVHILDQPARQCFLCVGNVVAPKPGTFGFDYVRNVCYFLPDPRHELMKLIDLGLVERLSNDRFQMHMLFTAYARARMAEVESYEAI